MNTYKKYLILFSFLVSIFGTSIYFFITPKAEISYFESRTLAVVPEFNKEKLFNGELMPEYEEYFVDHFPIRDTFVKLYKEYEIASPKMFVDGKFHITKDDWILLKPDTKYSKDEIIKAATATNEFADYAEGLGAKVHVISFPEKMNNVKIELPSLVNKSAWEEQRELFYSTLSDDLDVLKVADKLKSELTDEEINALYFKTDHHWNMNGAYEGYKAVVSHLNVDYDNMSKNYKKACLDASEIKFYGSWNKQLYGMVDTDKEELCHYDPTSEETDFYTSEIYFGLQTEEASEWKFIYGKGLYDLSTKKIDYGDLYTGDLSSFRIINRDSQNTKKVLILKDSYTNPIVGQLSNHFAETVIFDLRHNDDGVLKNLLETEHFDDILITYHDRDLIGELYEFN